MGGIEKGCKMLDVRCKMLDVRCKMAVSRIDFRRLSVFYFHFWKFICVKGKNWLSLLEYDKIDSATV
jgi:hypothetical protein